MFALSLGVLMLLQEGVYRNLPSTDFLVTTLTWRRGRTLAFSLSLSVIILGAAIALWPHLSAVWKVGVLISVVSLPPLMYRAHRRSVVLMIWRIESGREDELKALRGFRTTFVVAGWSMELALVAIAVFISLLHPDDAYSFAVILVSIVGAASLSVAHWRERAFIRQVSSVAAMNDTDVLRTLRGIIADAATPPI